MQNPNPNKGADLKRFQVELTMLQSDFNKKEREKADLEAEKRAVKLKIDRIQLEMEEKNMAIKKIERDQFILQNDINSLKRKINSL